MRGLTSLPADRHLAGSFLLLAFAFIFLEFAYGRLSRQKDLHDAKETLASFGVAIGDAVVKTVSSSVAAAPFVFAFEHRLVEITLNSPWKWAALFLGVEFCYYWFHRASHRVRWLWATHAVHHSATHFNLSAAIRLGWTGQFTGAFIFFLPLAWLGFPPPAVAAMLGLGLVYQFFLHTALPVNLGPLEHVLNTPNHHRVHHASNAGCLDKNYGSVLIVFDKMFGTFAAPPANETLTFGVKGRSLVHNPILVALREWISLASDVRLQPGLWKKLRVFLGPP
jgi:sterol desaturase/sphingolipid hydroxylase (fatty acid hydroxylase superfamily)